MENLSRPPLSVSEDVIFQRVSDGAVLLSTDGEIYYGLNEVGAEVWQGLSRGEGVDRICGELGDRYPGVDADRIRSDVSELLEELAEEGLVTRGEPRGDAQQGEGGGQGPGVGEHAADA